MQKRNASIIDICCGIGGFRLGIQKAIRSHCVFSSEWNESAATTYRANFHDWPEGDITQIDPRSIPRHDMLIAGIPCQAFSRAGLRRGFDDTRGTIFFNVAFIIQRHLPDVVLIENVRGLVHHDEGNTFRTIVRTLESLGYEVHHRVLNAKDFGLPQSRARVYVVAFRNDTIFPTRFTFPKPTHEVTSIGSVLELNPDPSFTLSDEVWTNTQAHKAREKAKGHGWGYSMVGPESVHTCTLTATGPHLVLLEQKGQNPRQFTPREWARLQGFPDSFILPSEPARAYHQLGNSVAVPVIEAIGRQIAKALSFHVGTLGVQLEGQTTGRPNKAKTVPIIRGVKRPTSDHGSSIGDRSETERFEVASLGAL